MTQSNLVRQPWARSAPLDGHRHEPGFAEEAPNGGAPEKTPGAAKKPDHSGHEVAADRGRGQVLKHLRLRVRQIINRGVAERDRAFEADEWISLSSNFLWHLPEIDPVEPEASIGTKTVDDFAPEPGKALCAHEIGEALGKQRSIARAEVRPEPRKTSQRRPPYDCERQDEKKLPIAVAAEYDRRDCPLRCAKVAMTVRDPIEGLQSCAGTMPLESFPFGLDLGEIAMKAEHDFLGLAVGHGRHKPLLARSMAEILQDIILIKSIKSEQMVLWS
jgi:hypothetical protein